MALRPDKDHPLSSGFACQKGIAFTEVVNDPDRVTTPLRRGRRRLRTGQLGRGDDRHRRPAAPISMRRHGSGAVGWYMGNPAAFSYSHLFGGDGLHQGPRRDSPTTSPRPPRTPVTGLLASQFLYGSPMVGADTRT